MRYVLDSAEAADVGQSAYIRYVVPTPDDQEATVEYDLDEEDEEWLQKHNSHVRMHCCTFIAALIPAT